MDRDEAVALVERMLSTMEDSGGFWADDVDGPRTYPSEVLAALRSPQEEAGGKVAINPDALRHPDTVDHDGMVAHDEAHVKCLFEFFRREPDTVSWSEVMAAVEGHRKALARSPGGTEGTMLDPEQWEPYREKYPWVIDAWEKLAIYVEHRAWGPGRNEGGEDRALEWTTTGLRLMKLGQRLRYLMDRLDGHTFDVLAAPTEDRPGEPASTGEEDQPYHSPQIIDVGALLRGEEDQP